jgi:CHASE2 domain-containing sensor protein
MATTAAGRTPAHLWIIGILTLLWNGFGCFDYFMTKTANQAYLSQMPTDAVAYANSLPAFATAFWALGVWGGLAGAILLLMRSRHSVLAFGVSLIGAVVGLGYQMFMTDMPASMKAGMMGVMPWLIIAVAAFQLWYSRNAERKGLLR